jgi:hypothetical protein
MPGGLCFECRMRTTVYIDGFNLYYRLLRARPPIKWVNPLALVQRILPDNEITKVRYFTARVSGRLDPDAPHRQQLYLDALSAVQEIHIHYGTFLEKPKYAGLVTPVLAKKHNNDKTFRPWPDVAYVWKTEEKGSDVNIATYLLLDAFQHSYEVAAGALADELPCISASAAVGSGSLDMCPLGTQLGASPMCPQGHIRNPLCFLSVCAP